MKLRELKEKLAAIPAAWDDLEIGYVDFSYSDDFHVHRHRHEGENDTLTITDCSCKKGSNTDKEKK